ncbi:hypothetical protein QJS04_geneDACA005143 [Acorus gramineus]|uniref:Uncharacterized protein n=1 Tax=Acorus gramineus TaxID=55184 RepID=A0AAV9AY07_ACOGR|nr:hypothetical protein QJS04_geneDACA005143 [Acorus gramineus]
MDRLGNRDLIETSFKRFDEVFSNFEDRFHECSGLKLGTSGRKMGTALWPGIEVLQANLPEGI